MKSLPAAAAALLLSSASAPAETLRAETLRIAAFACAGQDYLLMREAGPEGAYRLGRVENGGRRVRVVAAGAGPAATPEAVCGQVAILCGRSPILAAAQPAHPAAPVCLAEGLD